VGRVAGRGGGEDKRGGSSPLVDARRHVASRPAAPFHTRQHPELISYDASQGDSSTRCPRPITQLHQHHPHPGLRASREATCRNLGLQFVNPSSLKTPADLHPGIQGFGARGVKTKVDDLSWHIHNKYYQADVVFQIEDDAWGMLRAITGTHPATIILGERKYVRLPPLPSPRCARTDDERTGS
jgi:hypothetical protein